MAYKLQRALRLSMLISMVGSFFLLALGIFLYLFLPSLMNFYLDQLTESRSTTRVIITAQESITPTKDYLPEEIDFGYWLHLAPLFIIFFGASLFIFSLFGMVASTSSNADYLFILVILMMTGFISQFLIFRSIVDLNSIIHSEVKDQLLETLLKNYVVAAGSNSTFTFLVNSFMLLGECCGIEGPADFLNMGSLSYNYSIEDKSYYIPVLFPLACCKRHYIDMGFQATIECAKSKDISMINNMGCYEQTYAFILYNYGKVLVLLFTLLILWEMLQILTGLTILFAPSKVEMEAINMVFEAAEHEDLFTKMVLPVSSGSVIKEYQDVFVPHANVLASESETDIASQIW